MAAPDKQWLNRTSHPSAQLKHLTNRVNPLPMPGLTALICGGHFPGSMILHSSVTDIPTLFVADTIFAVASSHNPSGHYFPGETQTYQFLWSIPNMIPLPPSDVLQIWKMLKPWKFRATYGVIAKVTNVYESEVDKVTLKVKVLECAKRAERAIGY